MSNEKNSGANPLQFVFRIVQGALIGLGAVLPGISGGFSVLSSVSISRLWNFCQIQLRISRAMYRL